MLTLLVITYDRQISAWFTALKTRFQELSNGILYVQFKSFPTVYYMSDSDNRARNDDRLNLLRFFSTKRRLGFCGRKVIADLAVGSGKIIVLLH